MNQLFKLALLVITLTLMAIIIPFFINFLIAPSIPIKIPNETLCTDGCGQIPMYDPIVPIIIIVILPLVVIIVFILYIVRYKESG